MFHLRRLSITVTILTCFLQAQGADKYTDENRPYEFGFTIDGEQHRHEKKDENGLIKGEFGFITADGVYHVTVYATDENGNFKILSMKNIRVKPYPTAPERKGNSLPFPPSQKAPGSQSGAPGSQNLIPVPQTPAPKPISIAPPIKSCSHCSIPTTTRAPELTDYAVVSKDDQTYNNPQIPSNSQYPSNPQSPQYPQNPQYPTNSQYPENPQYPANSQYPSNPQNPEISQYPSNTQYPSSVQSSESPQYPQNSQYPQNPENNQYPQSPNNQGNYPNQPSYPGQDFPQQGVGAPQYPEQNLQTSERNPKQYDNIPPQYSQDGSVPNKPTLISAQMQIVDKNTDVHHRQPGEKEGLPDGLSKKDMHLLLYTFNYTVGFHGHHEEGYTDGTKTGYYYVTGRNGVRTRVDYVADEKGFRPKISQEVLDLVSEDVPKPETEKDAKYGLKGYEFKWIYYPVDSRRR